jgi:hypothetical protein
MGKNRPETLEGNPFGGGKGGGGGGGGAPQAPNPYEVANATTQVNQNAAAFNKALNLNNASNPFGSQTSSISGYDPATGAPIYQTNTSFNPGLQAAVGGLIGQAANAPGWAQNAQNTYAQAYGQLGNLNQQYGQLGGYLNQDSANQYAKQGQDAYYKAATSYLDPQYAQQQESLDAKLAAQGLAPGSQAYNNAMSNFQRDKDFAYNQAQQSAITQGNQIGLSQLEAQRQNIATQAGLLGQQGSTIGQQAGLGTASLGASQSPYAGLGSLAGLTQFGGPATSSVNPADIGSYINNQYLGQLGLYNARQQGNNQLTSGLIGAAGTLGAGYLMSDARVKRDIRRIGEWNGTPVYSYRYVFESKKRIGVLAQEAPKHAVREFGGLLMVDYRSL